MPLSRSRNRGMEGMHTVARQFRGQPKVPSHPCFLTVQPSEPKRVVLGHAAIVGYLTITNIFKQRGSLGVLSQKTYQIGFRLVKTAVSCELRPRLKLAFC